jgi:hypothetical protein
MERRRVARMVHACMSLSEEQAVEKGGAGGAQGATERTQHGASIGDGAARGAWRCCVLVVLAWCMLERATDGGPSCKRRGCADNINRKRVSIKKMPTRLD